MKTKTIDITQDDINNGIQGNPYRCPLALACQRAGLRDPYVARDHLEAGGDIIYEFSAAVAGFIRDFDLYGTGDPQTIVIHQP